MKTNSFKAVVTLKSEGFLLGGTRRYVSSAFVVEKNAQDFATQSVEVNRDRPRYSDAEISVEIIPVCSKNPIPDVNA